LPWLGGSAPALLVCAGHHPHDATGDDNRERGDAGKSQTETDQTDGGVGEVAVAEANPTADIFDGEN